MFSMLKINKMKTYIFIFLVAFIFGSMARFVPDYLTSHRLLANFNYLQILQNAIAWLVFTITLSLLFKVTSNLYLWEIVLFTIIYLTVAGVMYDVIGYISGDYINFSLKRYLIDRGIGGLIIIFFTGIFCGTTSHFFIEWINKHLSSRVR